MKANERFARRHAGRVLRVKPEYAPAFYPAGICRVVGFMTTNEAEIMVEFPNMEGWPLASETDSDRYCLVADVWPDRSYWWVGWEWGFGRKERDAEHPHECPTCGMPALILATTVECTSARCRHFR